MTGDLDIVKAGLVDRVGDVCAKLLPDGRAEGGLWVSWNPVENDKGKTPALKVRIRGGDLGAWRCWRCGEKGDVIKLVAYLMRTDTKGALAWGRDFLGIRSMSAAERAELRKVESTRRHDRERADARRLARKLQSAAALFHASPSDRETGPALCPHGTFPFGLGSPAEQHARRYFEARKVAIGLEVAPWSFSFSPATEWWKGAQWETSAERKIKTKRGPLFPAIHSAMRAPTGIVTACHVTFLDPVKPAKAPVQPPKLMFGEALGAVIELAPGAAHEPFWTCPTPGPLILAEGIETGLSFAVNVPEARVWAGGSLAGVASAPVHLPCVDWILFARDNNQGNAQAQKQFAAALERLEASGKRVVVEASHVGDDFNDLARGED
jgi:hypothetical protein